MKRRLMVAGLAGALFFGGASVAMAGPYDNGPGPGPGNSGDHPMHGLCTAYAHNSDKAKEKSPVFNERTPDEWEEVCEGVTPGGSRNGGGE